ncbi:hypothetical protein [Symbiopectobacterium purcellii]|uniref:hypothetical protein n=1 Tax=Symbiopectobacterium purcellii TaxID=2871826 RepID=UPI003F868CEA
MLIGILLSFEGFPQNAIYTDYFTVSIAGIKRLGCMTQILRNRRPFIDDTFLLLSAGLWNFHLRTA